MAAGEPAAADRFNDCGGGRTALLSDGDTRRYSESVPADRQH